MISVLLLLTCVQAIVLRAPTQPAALKKIDNADSELHESSDPNDPVDMLEREIDEANVKKFKPSDELIAGWTTKRSKQTSLKVSEADTEVDNGAIDAQKMTAVCTEQIANSEALHKECADPWFLHKDCRKAFQVPSYRLGDLFYGYCAPGRNAKWTKTYFPDSVAATYLEEKRGNRDFKALRQILDSEKYAKYEKPDNATAVVHLRGYDAFIKKVAAGGNYLRGLDFYRKVSKKAAANGLTKVVILTGDHHLQPTSNADSPFLGHDGKFSEKDIHFAIQQTERKLAEIQNSFENHGLTVEQRVNGNADCDFVYMSHSHNFVPAHGTFDDLITRMVRMNGKKVLE